MSDKRGRIKITREESIPFREIDGSIIQMVQYRTSVTVEQSEGQTVEELEKEIEEILLRNQKYILGKDPQHIKMRKQLNLVVEALRRNTTPQDYKSIILQAKAISDD